jgi:glycerol-3-phosphate dehydrogenase
VWRYSGVRSLYDDGSADPSSVTRDYHLALEAPDHGPALLSVYGGKVTTHRRLAEDALKLMAPHLPTMRAPWTADALLPGGDLAGGFDALVAGLRQRYPAFDPMMLHRLARRHGSLTGDILGSARVPGDLGEAFGLGLSEREVVHMRDQEWARTADDVLWRRTKLGLHLDADARETVAQRIDTLLKG